MTQKRVSLLPFLFAAAIATVSSCDSAANQVGVGAACIANADCTTEGQICLTDFKGGYCGEKGCTKHADCPDGSLCVTEGTANYCFLTCDSKDTCNANRTADNEANCSSSVTYVEDAPAGSKSCVPPSGS
jgi:hypothetical protein